MAAIRHLLPCFGAVLLSCANWSARLWLTPAFTITATTAAKEDAPRKLPATGKPEQITYTELPIAVIAKNHPSHKPKMLRCLTVASRLINTDLLNSYSIFNSSVMNLTSSGLILLMRSISSAGGSGLLSSWMTLLHSLPDSVSLSRYAAFRFAMLFDSLLQRFYNGLRLLNETPFCLGEW